MSEEDLKAISEMVKEAHRAGLLAEVIWSFGHEMKGGHYSVPLACSKALYEWDI